MEDNIDGRQISEAGKCMYAFKTYVFGSVCFRVYVCMCGHASSIDVWMDRYYACNANADHRASAQTDAHTLAGTVKYE